MPQPKFAALIGMDWGDKKHAWALQVEGSTQVEQGEMLHTPEAIQAWVAELGRRFLGRRLAIALEQSRGPLVFALGKYENLFPIHPTSAADYRKVFRPSGAKSDGPDAALHLDMLARRGDRATDSESGYSGNTHAATAGGRSAAVGERTDTDFPTAWGRSEGLLSAGVAVVRGSLRAGGVGFHRAVADAGGTAESQACQAARVLKEHQCQDQVKNQERLEAMRTAVVATRDGAVVTAGRAAACAAVRLLRDLSSRFGHTITDR